MNKTLRYSLLAVALVVVSGCSKRDNISPIPSVSSEAKRELNQPVNCKTAKNDLRVLEEERASAGKRALSGVRSVMPIAAVAGLLMGDYSDRVEVATGQYNADIDAKVAQIKKTCMIR